MNYKEHVERLGQFIEENFPNEPESPPIDAALDILFKQKLRIEDLEFRLKVVTKSEKLLNERISKHYR